MVNVITSVQINVRKVLNSQFSSSHLQYPIANQISEHVSKTMVFSRHHPRFWGNNSGVGLQNSAGSETLLVNRPWFFQKHKFTHFLLQNSIICGEEEGDEICGTSQEEVSD